MKIAELINNVEFNFNVPFRIYQYVPEYDSSREGEMILKYDSETDLSYDSELDNKDITAINMSNDKYVEIEYL